ncbi:hypothetical protein H5410_037928 [Solanum commersonii]|uniref:Uncharacterized protein n=1 Tax=Solanum commersonii TaxID=4109 RepID=A0A9J5YAW2_SOLCO|nr:hypothetical protein H5410_037928 [Solanum commersonii]
MHLLTFWIGGLNLKHFICSIYNHMSDFIQRLSQPGKRSQPAERGRSPPTSGTQITWVDTKDVHHQRKFRKID